MYKMNTLEYLKSKLNQIVPIIYLLSEDEHRAIMGIKEMSRTNNKYPTELFVYKATTGIRSIVEYESEIEEKRYSVTSQTIEANDAMIHIYQQKKIDRRQIFIITEADQFIDDNQIIRRLKDCAIQADNSDSNLKIIILLSSRLYLPNKLEKYVDVITYPYPDEEEIKVVIESWLDKFNSAAKKSHRELIEVRTDYEIINSLKGLIIPQIHQALSACIRITKEIDGTSRLDIAVLNSIKREAINKTSFLKFIEPKISFKDIGGLGRLKNWFNMMYGGWTNEGQEFGLPPVKGALLLGLPGCGKTHICEALASEWKINYLQFDPSMVFSSRVGESEGNMHLTLARVDSMQPCIMFVDEIEKGFAGMQSSSMSDAGTTARTISIFLIWMNNEESFVFVAATCNNVRDMPPELISRFDEIFYVAPPTVTEREQIIKIHVALRKRDPDKVNTAKLAQVCNHLSGREIMQAVKEAMYKAFSARKKDGISDLNNDFLEDALKRKIPIVKTMQKQLEYLIKWVGYDEESKDGVRARFANDEIDEIDALFEEILKKPPEQPQNNQNDIFPSEEPQF